MPDVPIGLAIQPGWWQDLERRYAQPQRHYHTIDHVRAVLRHWHRLDAEGCWDDRASTWVALLLHDAVYELGPLPPGSNERASAMLVRPWSTQFAIDVDVQLTEALILATADHGPTQPSEGDLALFLDCDMAILGAPAVDYDRYARQVRREWSHLDTATYAAGRAAFLRALSGQRIFHSDRFHTALHDTAQANIERELDSLC